MAVLGKLLDYSQARPPLDQVKAHGYSAVYRYVCSDKAEAGLPGKRLTPSERDQILHAGLDIGLHGEDNAAAAQAGYARGLEQGKQWAGYAHDVLAAPKGMTIVAAIDYDTAGTYPTVVSDYLHGVTDGLQGQYTVGVYGSIYVVDAALAEHAAVHGVQTIAWSHSKVSTWAHLYQHGGTEFPGTDYNDILRTPHGTWLQTLNGAAMTLDADDQAWLTTLVNSARDNINTIVRGQTPITESNIVSARDNINTITRGQTDIINGHTDTALAALETAVVDAVNAAAAAGGDPAQAAAAVVQAFAQKLGAP
jgi:hypothetical protein